MNEIFKIENYKHLLNIGRDNATIEVRILEHVLGICRNTAFFIKTTEHHPNNKMKNEVEKSKRELSLIREILDDSGNFTDVCVYLLEESELYGSEFHSYILKETEKNVNFWEVSKKLNESYFNFVINSSNAEMHLINISDNSALTETITIKSESFDFTVRVHSDDPYLITNVKWDDINHSALDFFCDVSGKFEITTHEMETLKFDGNFRVYTSLNKCVLIEK